VHAERQVVGKQQVLCAKSPEASWATGRKEHALKGVWQPVMQTYHGDGVGIGGWQSSNSFQW